MLAALKTRLDRSRENPSVRVVVLRSRGRLGASPFFIPFGDVKAAAVVHNLFMGLDLARTGERCGCDVEELQRLWQMRG